MSNCFTESTYGSAVIEIFTNMGYTHVYAPDLNRADCTSPPLLCWTRCFWTAWCA